MVRELDGEAVLLDVARGTYYGLNATGRRILALLDGERTLAEVVAVLEAEFEAPGEVLAESVRSLIGELETQGLIEPSR